MIAVRGLALVAALAGCDLEHTIGLSVDPGRVRLVERALRFERRDAIDALLVLDDSAAMGPAQQRLRPELPRIVGLLADANAMRSVHVGVITTDLGAPGISCGHARGGRLIPVGAAAPAGCLPPTATPWLTVTAQSANTPTGQPLDQTLACMTSVGEAGCGFEMPLEAARRQLLAPSGDDLGFLRDEALLVVVFLTNEDDCSVEPSADVLGTNPGYGPLTSFRCARYGLYCDGDLIGEQPARYTTCRPANAGDGGRLVEVSIYQALFGAPLGQGGAKADPGDVVIAGLHAPDAPVEVVAASGAAACGPGAGSCAALAHSCVQSDDASVFGDPAVRLHTLVAAGGGVSRSICEPSYRPFADELVARVEAAAVGAACVPGALVDPDAADCTVSVRGDSLRRCGAPEDGGPCWRVVEDRGCVEQVDPRDGTTQRRRLQLNGLERAGAAARCRVLSAI